VTCTEQLQTIQTFRLSSARRNTSHSLCLFLVPSSAEHLSPFVVAGWPLDWRRPLQGALQAALRFARTSPSLETSVRKSLTAAKTKEPTPTRWARMQFDTFRAAAQAASATVARPTVAERAQSADERQRHCAGRDAAPFGRANRTRKLPFKCVRARPSVSPAAQQWRNNAPLATRARQARPKSNCLAV